MRFLYLAAAFSLAALPAWAQSYNFAIGPHSDVMGRCSIALGEDAVAHGDHVLVISGEAARPIYEITPSLRALIDAEVAHMRATDPIVASGLDAMPGVIDYAIERFNQNCGAHVS